ncbi:unnamed protein product [Brassica oleracea var. botrytis]
MFGRLRLTTTMAIRSVFVVLFLLIIGGRWIVFADGSSGGAGRNGYSGGAWSSAVAPSNVGLAVAVTVMAGLAVAFTVAYSRRGSIGSPWSLRRRKHALQPSQWNAFFNDQGQLSDGGVKFLKKVRSGGVDPSIRPEVWPFLLGVYDLNSTEEERDSIRQQKQYVKPGLQRPLGVESGYGHRPQKICCSTMADTVEEPQLHNGTASSEPQTDQHPTSESLSGDDPKLTDEIPEMKPELTDAKVEEVQSEANDLKPEELQPVVIDAKPGLTDGKPEEVQTVLIDAKPELTHVNLAPEEKQIRSTEGDQGTSQAVMKKEDEGNRTFTMRELLSELKSDEGDGTPRSTVSPYSRESASQAAENNPAMDLINRIQVNDEEGRSRQRVLAFAARKYASSIERNPDDHDALYNWALILQESADNVSADSVSPSKDDLLEEACKKYDEATRLCPTLYDAYYNWAIAISDRAKMRGRTKEAEELWEQATNNYEKAVQLNWNSSQALNNWGLALQELSQIVPAREKEKVVRTAISKFRAAIRLQFDFHRAIYNLGTVLYGLAEDTLRTGGSGNGKDIPPGELYSQSAIYIAAAHSLKPSYSVYSSALRLVRSMLPLPHLKVGYLTAPPVGNSLAPHSDWKRTEFELNHERLLQVLKPEAREMGRNLSGKAETMSTNVEKKTVKVNITEIVSVTTCADLTLPPGAGLCIDTVHGPVYLVADSWESLDGWLDAIRLVYTIYARGKSDVLAGGREGACNPNLNQLSSKLKEE